MANTYPNSKVELFRTKLKPSMNAYVDGLSSYLATITVKDVLTCQYFKHDINTRIKLVYPEAKQVVNGYNYMRVTNFKADGTSDEQVIYYFITNTNAISENCVEYELLMDTIHTLGNDISSYGNPRNFKANTELIRMHRDRFVNKAVITTAIRKINKSSEDIVPFKVKNSDDTLLDVINDNWYLIYKGASAVDDPVNTYLLSDRAIDVGIESRGVSKTFTYEDLTDNRYYYLLDIDNPFGAIEIDNDGELLIGDPIQKPDQVTGYIVDSTKNVNIRGWVFHRVGTSLEYSIIYDDTFIVLDGANSKWSSYGNDADVTGNIYTGGEEWNSCTSFTITQANIFRVSSTDYLASLQTPEGIKYSVSNIEGIYIGDFTTQTLNTIEDVDRTESELIKIIKYPYCPIAYTKSGDIYDFGDDWVYDNGYMRYNQTNLPTFGNDDVVNADITELTCTVPAVRSDEDLKTDVTLVDYESKLYHSDFTTLKMVYDSFGKEIKLENIDIGENPTFKIGVDFKPTSTINSKMCFKMNYKMGDYKQSEDYDNYLLVTRNNEETILNSAYIDYIRNGYNYDKKSNAIALENQQRSATVSTIGGITGAIASTLGVLLGGPAVKAASIIGLGTSIVGAATSTVNAWENVNKLQESQANNMQAKLQQLQSQSASAVGTDDVDLMSYYSNNKLHKITYRPTNEMLLALAKAFDMTGYKAVGRGVPDVDSRIWYNYIQCDPVINVEGINTLKQVWLDDLKSKYRDGVTVFHKRIIDGENTWDFERIHENWEKFMIGE